jgi:hypothetical protein
MLSNSACARNGVPGSKLNTTGTDYRTGTAQQKVEVGKQRQHDVLSGRGSRISNHPGNEYFRYLVRSSKLRYLESKTQSEKKTIILQIIQNIEAQSPPGRFLQLDAKTRKWNLASLEHAKTKTGQALREDGPKLRQIAVLSHYFGKEKVIESIVLGTNLHSSTNDVDRPVSQDSTSTPSFPVLSDEQREPHVSKLPCPSRHHHQHINILDSMPEMCTWDHRLLRPYHPNTYAQQELYRTVIMVPNVYQKSSVEKRNNDWSEQSEAKRTMYL